MAYLVLARKWRPDSWEKLIAQDHVTGTLKNAIQHKRLAHAYLFTGPRGVGKTSAARILAKALNCEKGPVVTPCNACSNCQEITEGRSVDVLEIDGASNRGIDEVRNLRENIRYTPAKGQYRIYIIDEVHMLTTEAFNALLKTLEEPPSHVLFIFATTEPHKVPATIVSRCQRFDFRRMGTQHIISHLNTICKEEGIQIEDNALLLIARKAEGSMRDSQSILDQMISYTGNQIRAEDVVKALGLIDEELFFNVTQVLAERDIPKCFEIVENVFSSGYDLDEFLHGLGDHFRDLLIIKSTGSSDLIEKPESYRKRYQEMSERFQEEDLLRMIRILTDTTTLMKFSENSRVALEISLVKMAKLDRTVTLEDLLLKLSQWPPDSGEHLSVHPDEPPSPTKSPTDLSQPGSSPKKSKTEDSVKASSMSEQDGSSENKVESIPIKNSSESQKLSEDAGVDIQTIETRWEEIINCVKKKKITVGSFLQEGIPIRLDGNILEIGFGHSNGFHIDAIQRGKHFVEQAFQEVLNFNLKVRCIKGDYKQKDEKKTIAREDKLIRLKELGNENEVVQKIIDEFDVDIIE